MSALHFAVSTCIDLLTCFIFCVCVSGVVICSERAHAKKANAITRDQQAKSAAAGVAAAAAAVSGRRTFAAASAATAAAAATATTTTVGGGGVGLLPASGQVLQRRGVCLCRAGISARLT